MEIKTFFDTSTSTLTYVVHDPKTRDAVVIDPVLDYEPGASRTDTESVDAVIAFLRDNDLRPHFVLETHAHADHLSGSQRIRDAFPGAAVAIGAEITRVQEVFKQVFDLPADFPTDGSQFDRLLADEERLQAGSLAVDVINTPGHTPACVTFKIGDAVFTGDALFMPDSGTGRCDFPGGSAEQIYDSISRRIYSLPGDTRVFVGHDYQPNGRELAYESTVAEEKQHNVALPAGKDEQEFIDWRQTRDASLAAPKLLFPSVQVNVDAGRLPEPTASNHIRYLKIPINAFHAAEAAAEADVELREVKETS